MEILDFINKYIAILVLLIGTVIYVVKTWKQTSSDLSSSTTKLLQDEVDALKTRLETTTTQITQLNTQIIDLTSKMNKLKEENTYLTELINAALKDYFEKSDQERDLLKKKLKHNA